MAGQFVAVRISCMYVSPCFDELMSCKKKMWLLIRNPDDTVITGTMSSTSLGLGYILVKHPTKSG